MTSTGTSHQKDRRHRRRHSVEDVRGSLLFSYRCRVLDLSAEGMAVRTNTPLAPGRSYSLKLEHGEEGLRLSGTVAWCRLQGTEPDDTGESVPVYRAGIELDRKLDETSDERVADIRKLLEQRGVLHLERRISGRIAFPDAASGSERRTPGTPPSFVVRRLSHSGMVLEASVLPAVGDSLQLEAELEDERLDLPVQVTAVRELQAGDSGTGIRNDLIAEVTVTFGTLDATQRARLDTLIREELGLG
jgi:hypothetical protein